MEQLGTALVGSTSYKKLFKSVYGPLDIVPAILVGNTAATFLTGHALRDSATAGMKQRYTNAASIVNEAVGTGDDSTPTFDLAQSNVIAESVRAYDGSSSGLLRHSISVGTGAGGVDQIVFDIAPDTGVAIVADYDYYADSIGNTGACILMRDVTTTVGGGNMTSDACRDGSVDSALIIDSAGNAVDQYFKDAVPRVSFD